VLLQEAEEKLKRSIMIIDYDGEENVRLRNKIVSKLSKLEHKREVSAFKQVHMISLKELT